MAKRQRTYGYDGADQLVGEVRTGPVPFSDAYTYDHNGNRLTMTVNGSQTQSFGYDAHDKLMSGIGESETYDLNGNLLTQTLNGQKSSRTWDDEDRLTSLTMPDGHTDSFSYNGLGMRLTKNDPTGNYAYYTDGVSPASDVLSDNYSTFTPGIGETKGAAGGGYASVFYLADASGNSRGLLNGSGSSTDGYNWDAFGNLVSRYGSNPTGFAWNVSSGYQTDNDDGLTLLGHRYYDKRTGRFISQDPAGAGDNWYQYAGNNPMNKTDPSGLSDGLPGSLGAPDSHYGGLGGVLDSGAENFNNDGLNEATNNFVLNNGVFNEDAASAKSSGTSNLTLAKDKGNTMYGNISNRSSKSVVIEFDKDINGKDTLWRVVLEPGFESSNAVDVDFVLLSSFQGGYWAHLFPHIDYSVIDLPNDLQVVEPNVFRSDTMGNGLFPPSSGYPYLPGFQSSTLGAWGRGYVKPIPPTAHYGFPFI